MKYLGLEVPEGKTVVWMRPHVLIYKLHRTMYVVLKFLWAFYQEICAKPQFLNEDSLIADVKQSSLGDCWILASIATLTTRPEFFYRVVPPDQCMVDNYAGIFHFRLYLENTWVVSTPGQLTIPG